MQNRLQKLRDGIVDGAVGKDRMRALCLLLSLLFMSLLSGHASAQSSPTESEVKAAFLYNFARFVEWPPASFSNVAATFQICILGENPFGQELREITRDKRVNGHPFEVKDISSPQEARACQILFISPSEKKQVNQILESLRGASVLTVGDNKGFAQQGGMINFILEDDRVHFEVNLKAAEEAGLKISSKLLSVAKLVTV